MEEFSTVRPRGIIATPESLEIEVLDITGNPTRLVSLWATRRIVLIFVRHFGCVHCKAQVAELAPLVAELRSKDITPVLIGLGTWQRATEFVKEFKWEGEIYVDPNPDRSKTYPLFRLFRETRTILEVVRDPRTSAKTNDAIAKGFVSDPIDRSVGAPDLFQNGGTFVLGPGDLCDFAFRSEYVGDHASLTDLMRAATNVDSEGKDYVGPTTKKWAMELDVANRSFGSASTTPGVQGSVWPGDTTAPPVEKEELPRSLNIRIVIAVGAGVCVVTSYVISVLAGVVCAVAVAVIVWHKIRSFKTIPMTALMTLPQIDELRFKLGGGACDCGFLDSTDMSSHDPSASSVPFPTVSSAKKGVISGLAQIETIPQMQCLLRTCCYLREFLAKPHPLVGRPGPTCPFVPSSLKMNTIWIALVYATQQHTLAEVKKVVRDHINTYAKLEPTQGPKALFRTLILVFPTIPLRLTSMYIDQVQFELKQECVERGIMVGEFHLHNNASGLRNPDFYPLRTPYPTLAIRSMVPGDLVFLTPDKYPPDARIRMISFFLKHFDTEEGRRKIKPMDLEIAKDALAAAEADAKKEKTH